LLYGQKYAIFFQYEQKAFYKKKPKKNRLLRNIALGLGIGVLVNTVMNLQIPQKAVSVLTESVVVSEQVLCSMQSVFTRIPSYCRAALGPTQPSIQWVPEVW
jgi:hypothetical protein